MCKNRLGKRRKGKDRGIELNKGSERRIVELVLISCWIFFREMNKGIGEGINE